MPAKSEKQLRLIWAIRRKYKTKTKTPKKWKWVWGEEWIHLQKESFIIRFKDFINESLSEDDRNLIEDLMIDLADKYYLGFHDLNDGYGNEGSKEHVSVQFFLNSIDAMCISLLLKEEFDNKNKSQFEEDLELTLQKIERFGYEIIRLAWNSVYSGKTTYILEAKKTKTTKKLILDEEWTHLQKESFILKFRDFINESILTEEDREMVEDLMIDLADKYFLSIREHESGRGYLSVQHFGISPNAIQLGIQLNESFLEIVKGQFEIDLEITLQKIERFGFEIRRIAWNSVFANYTTYSFEAKKY